MINMWDKLQVNREPFSHRIHFNLLNYLLRNLITRRKHKQNISFTGDSRSLVVCVRCSLFTASTSLIFLFPCCSILADVWVFASIISQSASCLGERNSVYWILAPQIDRLSCLQFRKSPFCHSLAARKKLN